MKHKLLVESTNWYGKPLCIANGVLVKYAKGEIMWHSVVHDTCAQTINLPLKPWQKLVIKSRLFERISHIDVRWAVSLNENDILFLMQNKVYRLNLQNGQFEVELILKEGKPLTFLHIKQDRTFKESIVMGDYSANKGRKEVKIYRRNMVNATWETAYVFPAGFVRHIHGMVQDIQNQCVYIMTGDEDRESGIWITKDDFKTVQPIAVGHQLFRCCQMLPVDNSMWYLTDAPSEQNFLCQMKEGMVTRIAKIRGSVIYGTILKNYLFFSTTVEPEAYARNRVEYWMTNKKGKGIQDNHIHVCVLNADGEVEEIMQDQHDGLPLRLCQYAAANFCSDGKDTVYFSLTAVKKRDNHIFRIRLQDID